MLKNSSINIIIISFNFPSHKFYSKNESMLHHFANRDIFRHATPQIQTCHFLRKQQWTAVRFVCFNFVKEKWINVSLLMHLSQLVRYLFYLVHRASSWTYCTIFLFIHLAHWSADILCLYINSGFHSLIQCKKCVFKKQKTKIRWRYFSWSIQWPKWEKKTSHSRRWWCAAAVSHLNIALNIFSFQRVLNTYPRRYCQNYFYDFFGCRHWRRAAWIIIFLLNENLTLLLEWLRRNFCLDRWT